MSGIKLKESDRNVILIAIFILIILLTLKDCNRNKKLKTIKHQVELQTKVDSSFQSNVYIFINEYELIQKIELLQTERSTLHNMNEIVLKNTRPAIRINEINIEIDNLQKQLIKLR